MPRTDKGTFTKGPQHNHDTRDIKPLHQCPACDAYWAKEMGPEHDLNITTTTGETK